MIEYRDQLLLFSFPGGSEVKNLPANAVDTREWVLFLDQEDPLEEEMATCSAGSASATTISVSQSPEAGVPGRAQADLSPGDPVDPGSRLQTRLRAVSSRDLFPRVRLPGRTQIQRD